MGAGVECICEVCVCVCVLEERWGAQRKMCCVRDGAGLDGWFSRVTMEGRGCVVCVWRGLSGVSVREMLRWVSLCEVEWVELDGIGAAGCRRRLEVECWEPPRW